MVVVLLAAGTAVEDRNASGGTHEHSEHHAGDLVTLKTDAAGVAKFSYEYAGTSVGSGATNVVGRGLIVHRDADDFKTHPMYLVAFNFGRIHGSLPLRLHHGPDNPLQVQIHKNQRPFPGPHLCHR
jgi:Cu/Zn superoxide dismutase